MMGHAIHIFGLLAAIACALLVLRLRDLLSCALALGGCGFFVAWSYFALQAPDLGVVQLLVEVIKMCILVIVVAKTHRVAFAVEPLRTRILASALLAFVFLAFVALVSPAISEFGGRPTDLAKEYVASGEEETGSSNIVTSILLGYRVYDTLGEICVLFISIVGIAILLKRGGG
jgi:multisubunit Na+/H+ antiporter MnhB subunit